MRKSHKRPELIHSISILRTIAMQLMVSLLLSGILYSCSTPTQPGAVKPVNIILDTDIGPDFDDAGAMAVLHALADSGKAKILATISCNKDSLVVPTIEVINTYFGRPAIPVGAPKNKGVRMKASQHWPDSIVARFPHQSSSTKEAPDAVLQYRTILASQPDHSVTVVTVGFLTNLSNLLQSPADQISPLNGTDLVALKVKNLVSMAGKFPSGKEFNVYMDSTASKYCYTHWPTPIVFTGFEIGEKVKTGLRLIREQGENNPVREAYRIALKGSKEDEFGRMSWDQTAVLIAVYGATPFFQTTAGTISVNPDGSNGWIDDPAGNHSYVSFKMTPDSLSRFIEARMMHVPKKSAE
jgi:inosine-uridine nucleoside N-ribohydrolase